MIRALYLLELLQKAEIDFVFKGGTALMLLLSEPKRFSIDIDIIISEKLHRIEDVFSILIQESEFIHFKVDKRTDLSKIEKAHYKFYYKPVTNSRSKEEYILLDILYEKSHYGKYIQGIEVTSVFIKSIHENITVKMPISEAILGDKLTAFAPRTTGIPYYRNKEIEIIKQLFDIGNLFDIVENIEAVSMVFNQFAKTELAYRNISDCTPLDVLKDIYETSLVISTRGMGGIGNFEELQKGIRNIKNFIFSETFHLERAMILASKAAYLSAIIQSRTEDISRFSSPLEIVSWKIEQPFETKLNKLKKTNPEAFFYWYKAYELVR
ncbi:nucleotidyl transferase AbiEii/AbiGii toxin family protein [Brumimicrobium oceani]|uniref:nucleotidyl transferase AbiEii/AbiGii toxin family protein n=1 Tax=Brumimicrobium oceani TaxID=2100725 RepID=UPI001E346193|nr:nucleotidyl transferase AbiEii/AbiGii toxin family protein [Brumimicrobium oceani]